MAKSNKRRTHFPSLMVAMCASSLSMSTAFADDTEVFFGQVAGNVNSNPNILFVLDTSGSMGYTDGQSLTRLERMKNALEEILDNTTNVNVGVMNFNGSYGGGAVLYPVTPIDKIICEQGGCEEQISAPRVNNSSSDVEERVSNGSMSTTGSILGIGSSSNRGPEMVGLRYTDLEIPQGARITSAWLQFHASNSNSGNANIQIEGELASDSAAFTSVAYNASSRPRTAANTEWSPSTWYQGLTYETPDISDILQEVVDQSDWCGGNAMTLLLSGTGARAAKSFDQSPTDAPQLNFTFDTDNIPVGGGCINKTIVSSIAISSDDAEQWASYRSTNTDSSDLELVHDRGYEQIIGLRFADLAIPKNAEILSANIEFQVDRQQSGSLSLKIEGQAADNPATFRSVNYNISSRPRTGAVTWSNVPNPPVNSSLVTTDISSIAQSLVNRNGWKSGNAMVYLITKAAGGSRFREVESWDGERQNAAKLRIQYKAVNDGVEPIYLTARDELKDVVNGLREYGGTPVVDAYYEAARYYRGQSVDYGKKRGYYRSRYYRVSAPDSYTGGSVYRHNSCTDADLNNYYCYSEAINGSPVYVSPIKSECQTNHIVVLSDGQATSNSSSNKVRAMTGDSNCSVTSNWNDRCGAELGEYLSTNDQNSTISDKQTITTYTIGFNQNVALLENIANASGGSYYEADSSDELVTVFQSILGEVSAVDTSFVAPGATVNQFNRLTHRNDIYFALFKPSKRPVWTGNLKRYQVGKDGDKISINDSQDKNAVDDTTGFFKDTSKSAWLNGAPADGNSVALGGAAKRLVFNDTARRVFTHIGDYASLPNGGENLNQSDNALSENNNKITLNHLGIANSNSTAANTNLHRKQLLKWARGVDVRDEDEDDDSSDWRQHMGDPMHARPVILNYAVGNSTVTSVFVGTNEGYLHAFNSQNGDEVFSYVPQELLQNFNTFWNNQSSDKHPYGMDGSLSVWTTDTNGNVTIDAGEKAFLYAGMRRGGSNYYALNVANRISPKLAWVIESGTPGFEELGQTWSKMSPTKIRLNGQERDVLIFGAGYDENQDDSVDASGAPLPRTKDSKGRGIYIVDAETGERLYAALGSDTGDMQFAGMDYSIPSDLRILDSDYDGFADQIYASDMGGQVWRFDLTPYHVAGTDLLKGGIMADLSGSGVAGERRFYYEPDVAIISNNGDRFLSISIGSGWRAHPLDTDVQDRFYMIKSTNLFSAPAGYGKSNDGGATFTPITESDLIDVTNELHPATNAFGWMYDLPDAGEKVLGASVTANNQVIFTTYNPDLSVVGCKPAIGTGSIYALNVLNGGPAVDMDEDGELELEDRSKKLKHGGIPPEPAVLITDNGPTLLAGPEQPFDPNFENLTRRTFWVDSGDNEN